MPDTKIKVGALGIVEFRKGTYCYVGSAMNGLDRRIKRHLSDNKKIRWHIDYLTKECSGMEAYEAAPNISECGLGETVRENGGTDSIKGFGCSDCGCATHLFFLSTGAKEKLCSDHKLSPHSNLRVRF